MADNSGTILLASAVTLLLCHSLASAQADSTEVPSLQRHVLPLMGRLGCTGRACHGSFQGQGGFRLSLFGYDFKTDHELSAGESRYRASSNSLGQ